MRVRQLQAAASTATHHCRCVCARARLCSRCGLNLCSSALATVWPTTAPLPASKRFAPALRVAKRQRAYRDLDVDVIKGGDGRGLCKLIESSTGKLVTSVCVPAQWTKVPRNVEIAHVYVHATLSDLIKEVQVCLTIPASAVELDQQPFFDNGQLTFADSCVEMETCSDGDLADIPELLRPGDENVASRGNKRIKTGADPAQAASPSPPQPPQRFKSKGTTSCTHDSMLRTVTHALCLRNHGQQSTTCFENRRRPNIAAYI